MSRTGFMHKSGVCYNLHYINQLTHRGFVADIVRMNHPGTLLALIVEDGPQARRYRPKQTKSRGYRTKRRWAVVIKQAWGHNGPLPTHPYRPVPPFHIVPPCASIAIPPPSSLLTPPSSHLPPIFKCIVIIASAAFPATLLRVLNFERDGSSYMEVAVTILETKEIQTKVQENGSRSKNKTNIFISFFAYVHETHQP